MKLLTACLILASLAYFGAGSHAYDQLPDPVMYDICLVHEVDVGHALPGQCDFVPYLEQTHADGTKHNLQNDECFSTIRVMNGGPD